MIHGRKDVKIQELTSVYLCFNCGKSKVRKKEKKVKAIKNNGWCKKTTRNCFFRGHFKFISIENNNGTLQIQQLIIENNNQDNVNVLSNTIAKYSQMLDDKKLMLDDRKLI